MKQKKKYFFILMIIIYPTWVFSFFCLSNIFMTYEKLARFYNDVKYKQNFFDSKLKLLEPHLFKESLIVNQNVNSEWDEIILKVDRNRNGISDRFEQKLNSLNKSNTSIEGMNNEKILLKTELEKNMFNNYKNKNRKLSYKDIPVIIQFSDKNFNKSSTLFEFLGGKIKKIYNKAINGFSGYIDYKSLIQFCEFLNLEDKKFLIEEDRLYKANLYYTSRSMNLRPYCWNTLEFDGDESSSIAIVDTGIEPHNFFDPYDPINFRENFFYKIVGCRDEVNNKQTMPYDDNGHGSHCAGIAAGLGNPVYDINGRVVATCSLGFNYNGYYIYEDTFNITGARFNVTEAGLIEVDCQFNDLTPGSDEIRVWAYLYYGETIVDYNQTDFWTWSDTLSYNVTNSTLGEYSLRYIIDFNDTDGDDRVTDPHMGFRGEIHWPFNPPLMDGGNPWKGVAPDTHLVGVKVLDEYGMGWASDIINGINWVINNKLTFKITTMSLSIGGGEEDIGMINAVNNAVDAGIVTVVSAGNSGGIGNNIECPGDADKVITVAAMNLNDEVTEYSSAGGYSNTRNTKKPDIMAPGGSDHMFSVFSADTDDNDAQGEFSDFLSDDLAPMVGTSMAAPAVAGAANLLIEAMGGFSNWDYTITEANLVKALLLMTATETYPLGREIDSSYSPSLERGGKDIHEGYGRINVDAALEAYTQELEICSNKQALISSSSVNPFNKHAQGCYVDLLKGQNYNFHLLVPDGADFDLHLYSNATTQFGDPISEASSTSSVLGGDETIIFTPEDSGRFYLVSKAISGEGNAIIIWNHTRLDEVKIGSVISHGEMNPRIRYSDIVSELQNRGAFISDITSIINLGILNEFDIIWFDEYGINMNNNEIDETWRWIQNGGSLLITGDNMGSAMNLIQNFNISYVNMSGSGITDSIFLHQITMGVNQINFPSPLNSLNISLQSNAVSCVKLNDNDLIIIMQVGNGKITIISDEDLLINHDLADNNILIFNTFSWLAFKESIKPKKDLSLELGLLISQSNIPNYLLEIIFSITIGALIGVALTLILHKKYHKLRPLKRNKKQLLELIKIIKKRNLNN
ncbi:MAG: S8 family serine peptidase [Candidatus Hodarchaeota archaeon]